MATTGNTADIHCEKTVAGGTGEVERVLYEVGKCADTCSVEDKGA